MVSVLPFRKAKVVYWTDRPAKRHRRNGDMSHQPKDHSHGNAIKMDSLHQRKWKLDSVSGWRSYHLSKWENLMESNGLLPCGQKAFLRWTLPHSRSIYIREAAIFCSTVVLIQKFENVHRFVVGPLRLLSVCHRNPPQSWICTISMAVVSIL